MERKYYIYNVAQYEKNGEKKVVIEANLEDGKSRYPKKIFMNFEEAKELGGDFFDENDRFLGLRDKFLFVEEVYSLSDK